MLSSAGKYSHVTGLIRDRLHWLPVAQRIQSKLCLMMYKAMHGLAPAYLSCVESRTRSSARGDLVVQRTKTKFGGRAFVVAGPAEWNRLPCSVRNSPSLDSFKTALKTVFFTPGI